MKFHTILLASMIFISSQALCKTRDECLAELYPNTNLATGVGIGTAAGGAVGVAACAGFLGAAFLDFGLSYAACVGTVTLVGTVGGTATAEVVNNSEKKKCLKYPDK